MNVEEIVICCAIITLTGIALGMLVLYIRSLVREEYESLLAHIEDRTRDVAWGERTLQTGDLLGTFAPRFEGENFFQAHCVTHVAMVVRLPPSAHYEDLLVWDVRKRFKLDRDVMFVSYRDFIANYSTSGESIIVRRLESPLETSAVLRVARSMRHLVFDNRVQIKQVNEWAKAWTVLPLLPQTRSPESCRYCSSAVLDLMTKLGVFKPVPDRQAIVTPVEFMIPAKRSALPVPLERAILAPHRWRPLDRIVTPPSLRIGAAEERGDLRAARRLRAALRRERRARQHQAKRERRQRHKAPPAYS